MLYAGMSMLVFVFTLPLDRGLPSPPSPSILALIRWQADDVKALLSQADDRATPVTVQ
jgi:hypothetical protein